MIDDTAQAAASLAPSPAAPSSAWPWWLGRHPLLALTAALVIWGLVDVRSRGRIEPGNLVEHRTDFTVYTQACAACFDGRDPYAVTNARGWGYLYPPLLAILVAPLAVRSRVAGNRLVLCQSAVVVGLLSRSGAVGRLAGRRSARSVGAGQSHFALQNRDSPRGVQHRDNLPGAPNAAGPEAPPSWLPWAAAIAAALPTLNCLQRGQVGLLQLFLLLAGFRLLAAAPRGLGCFHGGTQRVTVGWRPLAAGVIFALVVVVKVTALLPVALVVIERLAAALGSRVASVRRHAGSVTIRLAAGLAFGGMLWLLVVPAAAIGWQRNLDCLCAGAAWCQPRRSIPDRTSLPAIRTACRNQSLTNGVRHLGNWIAEDLAGRGDSLRTVAPGEWPHVMDKPVVNHLLLAARLAVLVAAVLLAIWVGRRRDELACAGLFGLALMATLVVSPVVRTHYFLLIAPAVLLVPWQVHCAGHKRLAWCLAWVPTMLIVPQYLWPVAAGRMGWLGIGMTAWLISGGVALVAVGRKQSPSVRVLFWRQAAAEAVAFETVPFETVPTETVPFEAMAIDLAPVARQVREFSVAPVGRRNLAAPSGPHEAS